MKKTGRLQQYPSSNSQPDLQEIFGINVSTDSESKHPPTYFHPCRNIIYFSKKVPQNSSEYNPQILIATWGNYTESDFRLLPLAAEEKYTPMRSMTLFKDSSTTWNTSVSVNKVHNTAFCLHLFSTDTT